MRRQILWALIILAGLAFDASAQQFVYPAKGQSPEQQKSDEAACYTWAVQQSGFDPAKPPAPAPAAAPTAKPPTTATGTTPGAGARGHHQRLLGPRRARFPDPVGHRAQVVAEEGLHRPRRGRGRRCASRRPASRGSAAARRSRPWASPATPSGRSSRSPSDPARSPLARAAAACSASAFVTLAAAFSMAALALGWALNRRPMASFVAFRTSARSVSFFFASVAALVLAWDGQKAFGRYRALAANPAAQ